ncbi:MAG: SBBP repeat-containing protein [Candidatus Thorarchaeota archaeon]
MVKFKTVLLLILTLYSAALVCPLSSTGVAQDQRLSTAIQGALELPAMESSDLLLDLTAEFTYSTYFGGSGSDDNVHTMTDSDGNVWITGATTSDNLYTTPDAYNGTFSGSFDIFVIKLDGENGSLLYSTYFGGSNYELPMTIEIDSADNIWICGETGSSDFPTTSNAYNSTMTGALDMFIFSLSGTNGSLLYSTFVGGSGVESALSVDLDSEGNIWATGITDSGDFPMSPSSLYPGYNGSYDAVLFQISKNGTTMLYSTFFGGTDDDRGYEVLVDSSDDVWVAGTTNSFDFPITVDAYKNTASGGSDIYLLKLTGDGSTLLYSTYFGASGNEYVMSVTFDSYGNIWGTGSTTSGIFPTTPNAYDTSYGGSYDCIVFQFAQNGSTLLYSTYLGGSDQDYGRSIAVDRNNAVWISGDTGTDTFPTTPDAFNESLSGSRDAFLLSLAPNGTDLYYSTFLGGSQREIFTSLALSPSGRVWVAGKTDSIDFPTTDDAFNRSASGSDDLFVTSFIVYTAPDQPVNLSAIESVDRNVILLWEEPAHDGNSEVTSYRVYRNTTDGDFDIMLGSTTYEYFVDTGALPDTTYHYIVTAVNSYGESFASNEVNITMVTPTYRPDAPFSLNAIVEEDHVLLNWSAPLFDGGSSISVYHVYRRTFDDAYSELTSVASTFFNDTDTIEGVLYYYKVTAENVVGESEASSEVTAMVPDTTSPTINHPSDIEYTEGEIGHSIIWMPADTNPASFYIARNGITVISGAWLGDDITLNVDLLPEGIYSFNCTVMDEAGNAVSDVVMVTVAALPGPDTTTTTTTQPTTTPTNGIDAMTALILGGSVTGVVLVLSLLAIRKELSG